MSTPGPDRQSLPAPRQPDFLRTAFLVGAGLFVAQLGLAGALGGLPIRLFLKDHLRLDPSAVATFGALSGAPLYLKPLVGLVCDAVPLRGTRRRGWLLLGAVLGAGAWLLLGLVPRTFAALLAAAVAVNAAAVLAGTALGGVVVEEGQRYGATGRFAALRVMVTGAGAGLASIFGGWLATHDLTLTGAIGCGLFAFLFAVAYAFGREAPRACEPPSWEGAGRDVRTVLAARPLWMVLGIFVLVLVAPGFATPLLYFQTDTLGFTPARIGQVAFFGGMFGAPGPVLYAWLARRADARSLFTGAVALQAAATLLFLSYRSFGSAVAVMAANSLVGAVAETAAFDLATRATPRAAAALGFSILVSATNVTVALSDVLGSWLYTHLHLTFPSLVWLNAGTTALAAPITRMLPRSLTRSREGEGAAASAEAA